MPNNFHEFFVNADGVAARAKFEHLVIQLAHLRHGAMGVLADPKTGIKIELWTFTWLEGLLPEQPPYGLIANEDGQT